MAVREIKYTVDVGVITPATMQEGGVQGEHLATRLEFNISDALWEQLQAELSGVAGSKLIYRFDLYCADGSAIPTAPADLESQTVEYLVEERFARYPGKARVVLVITLFRGYIEGDSSTGMEMYSYAALLNIVAKPGFDNESNRESISALAEAAKQSADKAESNADRAELDRIATQNAMANFKEGSTVVFLGGDAKSSFDIELTVDEILSSESENPIANKAVKIGLNEILAEVDANKTEVDNTVAEMQAEIDEFVNSDGVKISEAGSFKVTGECFVDGSGHVNKWLYVKLNNRFFFIWGHFSIKPTQSNATGDIYTSESISVPLPFKIATTASSATGNSTYKQTLVNVLCNSESISFAFERHAAGISPNPTRVYLQVFGMTSDEVTTNE